MLIWRLKTKNRRPFQFRNDHSKLFLKTSNLIRFAHIYRTPKRDDCYEQRILNITSHNHYNPMKNRLERNIENIQTAGMKKWIRRLVYYVFCWRVPELINFSAVYFFYFACQYAEDVAVGHPSPYPCCLFDHCQ